ncbi:MAG TPA: hypothetical protein DHU96_24380, partial [Actinobacteria bacterium]|nr:hypothetical protein [Actinomycetota bacterium]
AGTGGAEGGIRIWDRRAGREADGPRLPDRPDGAARLGRVTALAAGELDSGEAIAVSGGLDGAVRVWNLTTRQVIGVR